MKAIIINVCLIFFVFYGFGQNLEKRLILIGDAGEINIQQSSLIHKAVDLIKRDSTLVFFLGDNIYPSGMALEGEERVASVKSLRSQFEPFRAVDVPVYFLAGNHDWNVSRPGGLEKLEAQESYLKAQNDKYLSLVPTAGDLGPIQIDVSDDFVIIAYDSEYWLYPYHSNNQDFLEKKVDFELKMKRLFDANQGKTILVLSHHPMITYGEHSLIFGWKQHVFPLTRVNKNWYVPLPILGSIYPLWRGKLFYSAEDLPSEPYQELVHAVMKAKGDNANVLFASGHDHGLQYIDDGKIRQIVSGSGSKSSFIINHKDLKYKYQDQGFCVVDCMDDGSMEVAYYIFQNSKAEKSYSTKIIKKP